MVNKARDSGVSTGGWKAKLVSVPLDCLSYRMFATTILIEKSMDLCRICASTLDCNTFPIKIFLCKMRRSFHLSFNDNWLGTSDKAFEMLKKSLSPWVAFGRRVCSDTDFEWKCLRSSIPDRNVNRITKNFGNGKMILRLVIRRCTSPEIHLLHEMQLHLQDRWSWPAAT